MITYDYFPWVILFRVGEHIIMHVSSLHDLQRNEMKYVVISDLIFTVFLSSGSDLGLITFKCNQLQLLLNFMITDYNYDYF